MKKFNKFIIEKYTIKDIPDNVLEKGKELLSKLSSKRTCGDTLNIDGWSIETHTLGCRYEAGTPQESWWDEHYEIFDEYEDDKNSYVMGDPTDGIFITFSKNIN